MKLDMFWASLTRIFGRQPYKTFALNGSDIEIIQKKWGANLSQMETFDSITEINRELHLFKNGKYFKVKTGTGKDSEIEGPFEMSKKWPFLPETIDAAFENRFKRTMYFFSGKFYWECPEKDKETEHALSDLGLPNTINKVDAGMWWRKNTAFILSGTKCWEVNVETGSVENVPRDINELFRGAPSTVDNFFNFQGRIHLSLKGTFSRIDTENGYKVDKTGNLKKDLLNLSTKDK
ncbi:hypothetical protein JZ751_012459 [Albula glossodonta]|uniref:Uncharacterized protein n=1 Tax=Albula glossodonta TaxID=121402 RepID=A0A8T2NSR9_9TELE|nr:hypothetical protein JZ751_012459 [Albula glossodonta]